MANKRMFSLNVVDTDRFLDMPVSAQALYFHLGMHGDDDGFVSSPQKITRAVGCNSDDLRLLAAKNFVIPFDSGVVVITDWKRNNTLRNDRYIATDYKAEKALLTEDKSGKYILAPTLDTNGIPNGTILEPQHNITEHNQTEGNKVDKADKPPQTRFSPPSVDEVKAYCQEKGYRIDPEHFVDFYQSNGWRVGKNPMRDWKAAIRNWAKNEKGMSNGKRDFEAAADSKFGAIGTRL